MTIIEFSMLESKGKHVSAKICDKKSNVVHPSAHIFRAVKEQYLTEMSQFGLMSSYKYLDL